MSKIRIAQIGTSRYSHGNFIFDALKKSPDIFEIAGYAMPEGEETKFPENMAAFQGFPRLTVEEICKDPGIQAVAVETEECFLTKYALLAARAGKHIHMEKPGSDDVEAFDTLIDTVKANRTVFHTGYMYRYNPFVQDLMARIRQGELGEILGVEAQMNTLHPPELRRWLGMYPGGSMFFWVSPDRSDFADSGPAGTNFAPEQIHRTGRRYRGGFLHGRFGISPGRFLCQGEFHGGGRLCPAAAGGGRQPENRGTEAL